MQRQRGRWDAIQHSPESSKTAILKIWDSGNPPDAGMHATLAIVTKGKVSRLFCEETSVPDGSMCKNKIPRRTF